MNWMSVSPQNLYVEILTLLWWYQEVGPLEDDQVMRMQPSWMGLVPFCKWGPRELACSLSTMWGHRRKWPAAWKRPPGPILRTDLQTPDLWEINVCSSLYSFCSIFYNTLTKTGGKKGKEILNKKYHADSRLSALHILTPLILTTNGYCYYQHFTDEEREAEERQSDFLTVTRKSQDSNTGSLVPEPMSSTPGGKDG